MPAPRSKDPAAMAAMQAAIAAYTGPVTRCSPGAAQAPEKSGAVVAQGAKGAGRHAGARLATAAMSITTGQRFGSWVVASVDPSGKRAACACACGRVVSVGTDALLGGLSIMWLPAPGAAAAPGAAQRGRRAPPAPRTELAARAIDLRACELAKKPSRARGPSEGY